MCRPNSGKKILINTLNANESLRMGAYVMSIGIVKAGVAAIPTVAGGTSSISANLN